MARNTITAAELRKLNEINEVLTGTRDYHLYTIPCEIKSKGRWRFAINMQKIPAATDLPIKRTGAAAYIMFNQNERYRITENIARLFGIDG